MNTCKLTLFPVCILLLLTIVAVGIHGYHIGVEDQDVYLAAINKNLNPTLYPVNSVFFTEQMKSSLFIRGVSESVRLSGVTVPWALWLWQVGGIFLVLLGSWRIAVVCFESAAARWAGVLMVTVLLTMPIAGTALFLVDSYLHPRTLAAAAILLALGACLRKNWIMTAIWLFLAMVMHPLMALFGISLIVFVGVEPWEKWRIANPSSAFLLLPLGLLHHPNGAWREATLSRRYYFPTMWTWYEWLGVIAPVLLVWWFSRIARRHGMATLELLSTRLLAFSAFQFVVGMLMTVPAATQQLSSLQPMRWLHIFYFLFLLMAGGLIGQFLLQKNTMRWLVLFVPIAGMMFFVQRDSFKYSDHIEWPGRVQKNPWARAFAWSNLHTPKDAVFAGDPNYMGIHTEDSYGLRGLAERSLLAENQKDPGAATVFPDLASEWREQVHAQYGIETFNASAFHELRTRYNVSWAVLPTTASVPLDCPYRNEAAQVCQVQ